jgi:hypothetical protein
VATCGLVDPDVAVSCEELRGLRVLTCG